MNIENSLVKVGGNHVQPPSGSGEDNVYVDVNVVTQTTHPPFRPLFGFAMLLSLAGVWGTPRLYLYRGDGKVSPRNGLMLLAGTGLFALGVFVIIDICLLLYFVGLPLSIIDGILASKEYRRNGGHWH
jgi:hypothetical protein